MNKVAEMASEVKDKAKALHDDRTHDSVRKPLAIQALSSHPGYTPNEAPVHARSTSFVRLNSHLHNAYAPSVAHNPFV
jgi:hypothetical protein